MAILKNHYKRQSDDNFSSRVAALTPSGRLGNEEGSSTKEKRPEGLDSKWVSPLVDSPLEEIEAQPNPTSKTVSSGDENAMHSNKNTTQPCRSNLTLIQRYQSD